jgi:hypothetical protein
MFQETGLMSDYIELEDDEEDDAPEDPPPPGYERVSYFVSIIMVAAAILITFTAWELRIYISDLESLVLDAEFNYTQAHITSQAQARQNYIIYSYYLANQTLLDELSAASDDETAYDGVLDQAYFLAGNNRFFVPGRYLKPDGSYDFDRNAAEVMARLGRRTTLDSAPLRQDAEAQLERKFAYMQVEFIFGICLAVLGFEKVFYWRRRITRYVLIILGVGLFAVATLQYLMLMPNPLAAFL